VCSAQSGRPSRASAKRESTGMEKGAATAARAKFECGARAARISRAARNKTKRKKVAYSQTDTGARTSDLAQANLFQPPTDTGSSEYIFRVEV
jgi:hypothetical protein